MKIYFLLGMMLLPCSTNAGTDCRVVEYPDHIEAVCVGESGHSSIQTRPDLPLKNETPEYMQVHKHRRPQPTEMENAKASRLQTMKNEREKELVDQGLDTK